MPNQHNNETKESRSRQAIAVAEKMAAEYRKQMVNTTQQVLFEEPEGQYFVGHGPNYVKVYVVGENLHNQVREVKITAVFQDGVKGELC